MEEVWNRGNFADLDQIVAPAYRVMLDPGDAWEGKILDRDEFAKRVLFTRNAFPDIHFEVHEAVEDEACSAIRWTMSGTHSGDLPMLPATNLPFKISGMTFYYFENGLVSGHRQAFDRLGFLAQIRALSLGS